jgi:hypothetical protein
LLVLSTQALSEKDKPICFRHKETHAIVRPCQTFKSDNDAYTRIFCMDEIAWGFNPRRSRICRNFALMDFYS